MGDCVQPHAHRSREPGWAKVRDVEQAAANDRAELGHVGP